MTIFHATLHTEHFHFEAFGSTANLAMSTLKQGFLRHLDEYGMKKAPAKEKNSRWLHYLPDVTVEARRLGEAIRDGLVIS